MSRIKTAKHQKSTNSLASQDFQKYFKGEMHLNQPQFDGETSSNHNSQYLTPQVPSSYTMIQVGAKKDDDNGTSKKEKTDKRKRKRSFVQPENGLVIKEVDEENHNRVDISGQVNYLKAMNPAEKGRLESSVQNKKEFDFSKPANCFSIDDNIVDPTQPAVVVNGAERYDFTQPEIRTKKQRNVKSGKNAPQNNIVMIALTDSTESKKLQAMKKTQDISSHQSSNILLDQDIHTQTLKKRKGEVTRVIPEGSFREYNFLREQRCCHSFINPQYDLSLKAGGFVMNAKKQFGYLNSCYFLSVEEKDFAKQSEGYTGYLKGNFTGSEFNVYQVKEDHHQIVATICYDTTCKLQAIARKMQIYVKNLDNRESFGENSSLKQLYSSAEDNTNRSIIKLVTKEPKYNKKHDCYSINFRGKSKFASTKNMVLVEEDYPNDYILMFCKTDSHEFHLEVTNPFSPLIALGVVLSGFDFKLCCQ